MNVLEQLPNDGVQYIDTFKYLHGETYQSKVYVSFKI